MENRYKVTILGETKEYPEGTPYGEIVGFVCGPVFPGMWFL